MLGRGMGIVSAYGQNHPAIDQIIDQIFVAFQRATQQMPSISLGTFNGKLAINDEPFAGKDAIAPRLFASVFQRTLGEIAADAFDGEPAARLIQVGRQNHLVVHQRRADDAFAGLP